jgi:hypothetical protein
MEEVIAGLVVVATAAGVGAIWRRRSLIANWLKVHLLSTRNLRLMMFRRRVDRQVKVAMRKAEANGEGIPLKRHGGLPTRVIYSDGSSSYYFCHALEAYKEALLRGQYPHDRTFHTRPPLTLRESIEKKLSESR